MSNISQPTQKTNLFTNTRWNDFLKSPFVARLAVIAIFVIFWEIGARYYNDPDFLATASQTAVAVVDLLQNASIWSAIGYMVLALFAGFALALAAGAGLGMLIGTYRTTYLIFFPIIVLLYAIPQVTLLPIFVLTFGIGIKVKIVYGFTHGFFPIIVCVIAGTQNINPVLLAAAKSMGATRFQIFRRIIFPYIIPSLFTGMRLGISAVLIGVILAELYASQNGVGYYTRHYSETFEPQKLFALVLLISVAGIALNEMLRQAETHFSRWRA
jgi:NitT/TauT family transport system permease protein